MSNSTASVWIGPGEYPYRVGPYPNAAHTRTVTVASSAIPEALDFASGWVRTASGWLPCRNPADPTELWLFEPPAARKARGLVPRESSLAITRPRLGVQIEKLDDGPSIISHCPRQSFAHADGLMCSDEIVSVAGKDTKRSTVDEVIDLLRASKRPTPIVVRRWAKSEPNGSGAFAVWIGPADYPYRMRDVATAAPSGQHRVATDSVVAPVLAFGTAWLNTPKGWLPITNPADPTELWAWEPPSSRRSRGQVPTQHNVTIATPSLGVNIEHINLGPCFAAGCTTDAPACVHACAHACVHACVRACMCARVLRLVVVCRPRNHRRRLPCHRLSASSSSPPSPSPREVVAVAFLAGCRRVRASGKGSPLMHAPALH